MIDTSHLLPPECGPRSNPVLHGVATALADLLPLAVLQPMCCNEPDQEQASLAAEDTVAEDQAVLG